MAHGTSLSPKRRRKSDIKSALGDEGTGKIAREQQFGKNATHNVNALKSVFELFFMAMYMKIHS
jgi:hypothetical protein